jgi:hypothetical protein
MTEYTVGLITALQTYCDIKRMGLYAKSIYQHTGIA